MRRLVATAALSLAAALLAASPAAAASQKKQTPPSARKAPVAQDWTKVVTATPEGGFRMGNPAAALKLVEYGSFTCSSCVNFAAQGMPSLTRDYVKSGKASLEYRSFVRDPFDMTAALVARCAAPAKFFDLAHRIFAGHSDWIGKINAMTPEQVKAADALPVPQRIVRFSAIAGFDTMAAQAGIPAAKLRQCLIDKRAMDRLVSMRQQAMNAHGLHGTPTFLINGKMTEVHDWSGLQPLLGPPGG
jgi:protein-disulfide isomerase